jgi:hypothetical protein
MKPERFRKCRRISVLALSATVGWVASQFSGPAIAAEMSFGNQGVRVNRELDVQSEFVESHGAYQSTFGVINLTTKEKTPLLVETKPADNPDTIFRPSTKIDDVGTELDFRGTPGNAVPETTSSYNFKPGNDYVFYLESSFNNRPTGILYSTDSLNPNQEQHVQFRGNLNDLCQSGGMGLGWDDTGSRIVRDRPSQDRDFDDFIVRMRDTKCAVGSAEPPPVVSPISPPPQPVGSLPPAAPGGGSSLLPALAGIGVVGGVVAAFAGGDDDDDGGGGGAAGGGGGGAEPIPEPMTILGSTAAIGMATLMQRRRSKKNNKDKK